MIYAHTYYNDAFNSIKSLCGLGSAGFVETNYSYLCSSVNIDDVI